MVYTEQTKKALKLCFEAHKNQIDKSGMPYVFHSFHLAEQMTDEKTTVVALLHDVIEDTHYSSDEVKRMIEHQKKKYGWEFLFIGANIDAVETAAQFGIEKDRAVNYRADSQGTQILYDTISAPISAMRANMTIDKDWGKRIEDDNKRV